MKRAGKKRAEKKTVAKNVVTKAKRLSKKVEKKAKPVITIWRYVVAFILFLIIYPTFLATHQKDNFYLIMLCTTAIFVAILFIIQRPLKRSFREYLEKARIFLLIGGMVLAIVLAIVNASPLPVSPVLRAALLLAAAAFYALAAQRLGLGILIVGI